MMVFETGELESPIGKVFVTVQGDRLCGLGFEEQWPRKGAQLEKRFGAVELRPAADPGGVLSLLRKYFAGEIEALDAIVVDTGGTPFQQRVWSELRKIPVGRTASYGDIARAIGAPTAVRAVGAANGANPVGIVVPCHRVIGSNGQLTGYGGGIERKRWLLRHESAQCELRVA
jgi:methylated-DNA-[protein]-cysteine S-methyltransferase